jgi:diadenosine tetraphosphate (Ap4A) HIT family hydrolase
MTTFVLHPQLEKDSVLVTELTLCSVRLINDINYPWLILVPQVAEISDIIDLSDAQQ